MTTNPTKGSNRRSPIGKLIRVILPLALGIIILGYLYKGTDFNEMWNIIKDAKFGWLAFSLLFGTLGNTIKGLRWELLITPLGYQPKRSNLIFAIWGNYAINFVLPRAGEVWRCGVVAKKEQIPFAKLLGTMVIDRVFDTLTVFCIVLLAIACNVGAFETYLSQNPEALTQITSLLTSAKLYIVVILTILFVFCIFKFFAKSSLVIKIKNIFIGFGRDIRSVQMMKQKRLFFLYTVGTWLSYFCYFYLTFFAFGFTSNLGIAAGLTVFAISSVGMAVPSNGGAGPWQFAVVASLAIFGVQHTDAIAFATAVFAIQSLWVVLYGLFGIFALSAKKRTI